jgi:hypothetical protein
MTYEWVHRKIWETASHQQSVDAWVIRPEALELAWKIEGIPHDPWQVLVNRMRSHVALVWAIDTHTQLVLQPQEKADAC